MKYSIFHELLWLVPIMLSWAGMSVDLVHIEIWGEPRDNKLVLVVQGRLAWGKVNKNDGIYIFQSYEVWPSGKKVTEGDGTINNTRECSGKNILERTGQLWYTKDHNGVKKRRAVNGAWTANGIKYKEKAYWRRETKGVIIMVPSLEEWLMSSSKEEIKMGDLVSTIHQNEAANWPIG